MRDLTFEDYCFIGLIDNDLKEKIKQYYTYYIEQGYSVKDSVVRSLGMFTNTHQYVERIEYYLRNST